MQLWKFKEFKKKIIIEKFFPSLDEWRKTGCYDQMKSSEFNFIKLTYHALLITLIQSRLCYHQSTNYPNLNSLSKITQVLKFKLLSIPWLV